MSPVTQTSILENLPSGISHQLHTSETKYAQLDDLVDCKNLLMTINNQSAHTTTVVSDMEAYQLKQQITALADQVATSGS